MPTPNSGRAASYLLRLTHEDRELVHAAARARGLTAREYITAHVLDAARRDAGDVALEHDLAPNMTKAGPRRTG